MPPVSRRQLLGGAAALGAGCGKKPAAPVAPTQVPGLKGWRVGEERWVPSTCGMCDAGCGIRVRVVEGRAVKIEGNPEHPVNRGGLCARGQAGLQALCDRERVRTPLRRVNGHLQPIGWDQALGEVTERLAKLRASGHPERLLLIDGDFRGFTHELWARFMEAYGSPNHVGCEANSHGGVALAVRHMQGEYELPAFDLERARLVLVMGAELLESSSQTMHFLRAASAVDERGQRRLRVVCASPRRPAGGCRVDEWIPVPPGRAGALALGIAHVLLRDGLCDTDDLRAHAVAFERWRDGQGREQAGFREQVEDFPPRKTAELTGVSVEHIEQLAHALAKTKPSLVATAGDMSRASNGLATAMAMHGLNALLGAVSRPGGVFPSPRAPLSPWPAVVPDSVARFGRQQARMDGAGTADCPFGVSRVQSVGLRRHQADIVFLHEAQAAFALPGRARLSLAGPFTVSFSSVLRGLDSTADLVLPAPSALETWGVVQPAPAGLVPSLGLRQPVVAPVGQTRPVGDVVLQMAAALGGEVAKALPWPSYKDAVVERLRGLCVSDDEPQALLADMEEKGGWWPEQADAQPPSVPRKFSFLASPPAGLAVQAMVPGWQTASLPPSGELILVPYHPVGGPDLPLGFAWLEQLPLSAAGWVEMNPDDAVRLGLRAGDRVRVDRAPRPEESGNELLVDKPVLARVKPHGGVHQGTVAVPLAVATAEILSLMAQTSDPLSGLIAWQETRVRVARQS